MELPWKSTGMEEKVEELEEEIERLEEENQRFRKRFEAEKERRSKLSSEKQAAEEELNRLKDRLRDSGDDEDEKEDEAETEVESIGVGRTKRILEKLGSIESAENDLVTVYSPSKLSDLDDFKGLKNAVDREQFNHLKQKSSFAAFIDPDLSSYIVEAAPFYNQEFQVGEVFAVKELIEFIESEKYWVLVSMGDTRVYREENGDYEEVNRVSSRVDRKHSQGGFSQQRFERKREEQIQQHLEKVSEMLEEYDEGKLFLLGEKKHCEDLKGEYLSGFDPNRNKPAQFYGLRLTRF